MLFGKSRRSTSHGSAGWTRPARDLLIPKGTPLPPGSFVLSQTKRHVVALSCEEAQKHGIIIGGSGTGKSRGYLITNSAFANNTSLVCTDPKGELWRMTSGYHQNATRFAPTEPERSACFNWIPLCSSAKVSELCARAIVESVSSEREEATWLALETAFLAALFSHASTLSEPSPLTAYRLFTRQPPEQLLEQLLSSSSPSAQEQAMIFQQTSDRMRGSIVPVVAAKLQFLRQPEIARFCSASYFSPDFGRLRHEPNALYWCMPESMIGMLRPLTSLFFSLLLQQIADDEIPDSQPYTPIVMLMDEFANIGIIPQMDTTISLARGRGVSLWLGIQSLSQLEARYGKANARTILTNCSCKIALHGLDVETARYVSETLGEQTVITNKKARHRRWLLWQPTSATLSEAEHGRPLLTADEVRRIETDTAIVIVGNRRPMLLQKGYYDAPPCEAPCGALGEAQGIDLPVSADIPRRLTVPALPEDLPLKLMFLNKRTG